MEYQFNANFKDAQEKEGKFTEPKIKIKMSEALLVTQPVLIKEIRICTKIVPSLKYLKTDAKRSIICTSLFE